jgi:uncharacterized protein (DUF1778 family)
MSAAKLDETEVRTTQSISLRVQPHRLELIDRAARAIGKTRTDLILDAATRASEDVLLNQRVFQLNEADYEAFVAALDAPPRPVTELRKLLAEPAPWER